MNRRTYISAWVRGGILASFATLGALFLDRRQLTAGEACPIDFACTRCSILDSCRLPEAAESRKAGTKR